MGRLSFTGDGDRWLSWFRKLAVENALLETSRLFDDFSERLSGLRDRSRDTGLVEFLLRDFVNISKALLLKSSHRILRFWGHSSLVSKVSH